jgi:phosphate starvation-inducible PhoH-like protein
MKKQNYFNIPIYKPKTVNQEHYVNCLNNIDSKIIISVGPAGTGKTMFACQKAISQMKSDQINKIIITRPVVTVEEEIGFLPGNIIKKMDPWTKPIFDIFLEYYSRVELDLMLNNGKIEICPLAFMRGRTFKNAFIIADEMQNSSPNQMKMLTTRLGDNSRMVITGDLKQTDILKENGLYDFITRLEKHNNTELIKLIKLDNNDIERSEIVKKVIEIYEENKSNIISSNNEDTCCNEEIKKPNYVIPDYTKNKNYVDSDAALIPKQHISTNYRKTNNIMKFSENTTNTTNNYDIFFEQFF